jgi:hypothetical protein
MDAQQMQKALARVIADMQLRQWCVQKAIEGKMSAEEIYEFVTKPAFDAVRE